MFHKSIPVVSEKAFDSAQSVQQLKNDAITLGINNELTLLDRRIEQEFTNQNYQIEQQRLNHVQDLVKEKALIELRIERDTHIVGFNAISLDISILLEFLVGVVDIWLFQTWKPRNPETWVSLSISCSISLSLSLSLSRTATVRSNRIVRSNRTVR